MACSAMIVRISFLGRRRSWRWLLGAHCFPSLTGDRPCGAPGPVRRPPAAPRANPVSLAQRGRDRHELHLQLGQPLSLVDLGELSVDVETPLDQLDPMYRRRFFAQPLFDLGTPLFKAGPAPCRYLRRPSDDAQSARRTANVACPNNRVVRAEAEGLGTLAVVEAVAGPGMNDEDQVG